MGMKEECCGTCKWHKSDGTDWYCECEYSDAYAAITMYDDNCDEWEER